MNQLELRNGEVIMGNNGCYNVLRKVREGGVTTQYLAADSSGRMVAIKESCLSIPQNLSIYVGALKNETLILQDLKHESIVRYVDSSDKNGLPYLIGEYIDGKTLNEIYFDSQGDFETIDRRSILIEDI